MKEFKKKNSFLKLANNLTLISRLFKPFYTILFIKIILISGCSSLKRNEKLDLCSSTELPCLLSNEYVLLITNRGNIKLKLYGELAPITVGNFIDYVEKGTYNGSIFNRVIKKPYPFIIRVGENILMESENNLKYKNSGKRYIPLEIKLKNKNLPIYGKEIDISDQLNSVELKHERSYLSMARSKTLNSASSQFYILLKTLPELDGRYAVFGKVISGMKVVDLIKEDDFIIKAKRVDF